MRLALELIIAGLIIALAWEKSFKDRVADIPVIGEKLTPVQNRPRPTATVSGSWMWDPNRKTALDRPSPTPRVKDDH